MMADESPNHPPKKPEDKHPEPSDNPADQSPGLRSQLGRWRPRRTRAGTTVFYINMQSGQPTLQPTLTLPSTVSSDGSSNMPVFRISLPSGSSGPPQVVSTSGYRRRSLSEISICNWSGGSLFAGHGSSRPSSGHDSSRPSSGQDTPRPGSTASAMNVRQDSGSETQSELSQDTLGAMSEETLEDRIMRLWALNYRPPLPRDQLESMSMESNPTRPWRGSVDSFETDSTLQSSASIDLSAQTAPRICPDGASSSESETSSQSTVREVAIPRPESGASYFADSSASSSRGGPASSASLRTDSPSHLERRMEAVSVARLGRRLGFPAPPAESSTSMSYTPGGSECSLDESTGMSYTPSQSERSLDAFNVAMSGSLVAWNPSSSDVTGGGGLPPGWLAEELEAVGGEDPRVQRGRRRSSSAPFPFVRWGSPSSGAVIEVVAPGDETGAEAGPQFYISSGQSDRGSQAEESDASDPPAQNPFRAVQMEQGSSDTLTALESGSTSSRSSMDPSRQS